MTWGGSPLGSRYEDRACDLQVPGQLLRQEDIGPELVGRRAEMLWPDDSQWYASVMALPLA